MSMKKTLVERSLVIGLFLLVMIAFSLAERDTRKAFEKYNTKNTVELPKKTVDYTAEAEDPSNHNKTSRN